MCVDLYFIALSTTPFRRKKREKRKMLSLKIAKKFNVSFDIYYKAFTVFMKIYIFLYEQQLNGKRWEVDLI